MALQRAGRCPPDSGQCLESSLSKKRHLLWKRTAHVLQQLVVVVFFCCCAHKIAGLKACKTEVMELCATHHCNPILVRLAWHDAGKLEKKKKRCLTCATCFLLVLEGVLSPLRLVFVSRRPCIPAWLVCPACTKFGIARAATVPEKPSNTTSRVFLQQAPGSLQIGSWLFLLRPLRIVSFSRRCNYSPAKRQPHWLNELGVWTLQFFMRPWTPPAVHVLRANRTYSSVYIFRCFTLTNSCDVKQ